MSNNELFPVVATLPYFLSFTACWNCAFLCSYVLSRSSFSIALLKLISVLLLSFAAILFLTALSLSLWSCDRLYSYTDYIYFGLTATPITETALLCGVL